MNAILRLFRLFGHSGNVFAVEAILWQLDAGKSSLGEALKVLYGTPE
jgi:hypothetical protein